MLRLQQIRHGSISLAICFGIFLCGCQGRDHGRSEDGANIGSAHGFIAKNGSPVSLNSPIIFGVDSSVPQEFALACVRAAATLNKYLGKEWLSVSINGQSATNGYVIRASGEKTLEPQHQASTTLKIQHHQIVGADLRLLTAQYIYSDRPNADQIDNESVCLHEMGHVLGLEHSARPDSFMYAILKNGQIRRDLSTFDLQNLANVY
jgi:hypothetical protein